MPSFRDGKDIYVQLPVGAKQRWCPGIVVLVDGEIVTALVEAPPGYEGVEVKEIKLKDGAPLGAVLVRGKRSGFQLKPPVGVRVKVRMTAADALVAFRSLETEPDLAFETPTETEDNAHLRKRIEQLEAQLRRAGGTSGRNVEPIDVEDEDSEDDEEEDELTRLARSMQAQWGGGLSRSGAQSSAPQMPSIQSAMAAPPSALTPETVNMLVMKEILATLQKLQRKGQGDDSSDEEAGKSVGVGKVAKSLRAYHKLKSSIHTRPKKIVAEWLEIVQDELGTQPGQSYNTKDYAKKINWGRHRTLQKMMEMLLSVFELQQRKQHDAAQALVVQCAKAVHQTVLDDGSWKNSWLITTLTDPSHPRRFGGTETELEIVAAVSKDLEELQKRAAHKDKDKEGA